MTQAKAGKGKKKASGAACPACDGKGVETPLRLDSESGKYVCGQGHEFTMEELRLALENPAKAAKPLAAGIAKYSEVGQEAVEEVFQSRDEEDPLEPALEGAGGSHPKDDLMLAILPNGDLPIRVVIPEAMVQPIVELAAQEKKTPSEWVQDLIVFNLEDYFSVPSR